MVVGPHAEMEKIYKKHLKGTGEMVVPMIAQNGKYAMGEEGSMRLFKSLMWGNIKELKQTLGLLMKKGDHEGVLLPQVPVEAGWDRKTFLEGVLKLRGDIHLRKA